MKVTLWADKTNELNEDLCQMTSETLVCIITSATVKLYKRNITYIY